MYAQLPMYQRVGEAAFKKNLDNTIKLCSIVGNPQDTFQSIHIAGTNGKGTTTHIIAAGLQAQGYKVGVYTSPHYKDFRERIKINGEYISKKYVIDFIQSNKAHLEDIKPSFFEMTVALAFSYFADEHVDFAVIETGLGGRLDSTNVISPLISVITNISFDHQNMLGNTLPEIAGEKAGIIKKSVPVVIGEYQKEVAYVFEDKARALQSNLTFAEHELDLVPYEENDTTSIAYDVKIRDFGSTWIEHLKTDLHGPFQEKNLKTGLYALFLLSKTVAIDPLKIVPFFKSLSEHTKYMGRWQVLSHQPYVLIDSAHNIGGLQLVLGELAKIEYARLHMVLGFVNDKDLHDIFKLLPKDAHYYWAKANIPRGLDAMKLKEDGMSYGLAGKSYISVKKAKAAALKSAKPNDVVYIGGSIFVVAEVI